MRPITSALLILAVLILPSSCGGQRVRRDRGQSQSDHQTLDFDGRQRTYVLRVPPTITQSSTPRALVIVLHGGGGNGLIAEKMSGFTEKAIAEDFIIAYPDGTGRRGNVLLTWNAGHCCGDAMKEKVYDVGFIGALIDELVVRYPIDRKRVYVTGMSNGGMMAHRVGIELSDKVAAIAPVVGALFGNDGHPHSPVSALMFNGLLDESVPVGGGETGGRFGGAWDGTPMKPASEQGRFWAAADGCKAVPRVIDGSAYQLVRYECSAPIAVESYLVKDQGHAWPGGKQGTRRANGPSTAITATDVMWEFFKAHPKR
jgi:polyhydroxybutyrate depolymerase